MNNIKFLNANAVKLIAIIAMTIDHIAWAAFPGYPTDAVPVIMHIIGRITCPIMCYFIAEGYHYTKNINKYTGRLFLFAFISHFAYVYASDSYVDFKSFIPFYYGDFLNQTSVMWSLAIGLVMLRVANSKKIKSILKVLVIIALCILSFPSDWSCIAALCILAIGQTETSLKCRCFLWFFMWQSMHLFIILQWINFTELSKCLLCLLFRLLHCIMAKKGTIIR